MPKSGDQATPELGASVSGVLVERGVAVLVKTLGVGRDGAGEVPGVGEAFETAKGTAEERELRLSGEL